MSSALLKRTCKPLIAVENLKRRQAFIPTLLMRVTALMRLHGA